MYWRKQKMWGWIKGILPGMNSVITGIILFLFSLGIVLLLISHGIIREPILGRGYFRGEIDLLVFVILSLAVLSTYFAIKAREDARNSFKSSELVRETLASFLIGFKKIMAELPHFFEDSCETLKIFWPTPAFGSMFHEAEYKKLRLQLFDKLEKIDVDAFKEVQFIFFEKVSHKDHFDAARNWHKYSLFRDEVFCVLNKIKELQQRMIRPEFSNLLKEIQKNLPDICTKIKELPKGAFHDEMERLWNETNIELPKVVSSSEQNGTSTKGSDILNKLMTMKTRLERGQVDLSGYSLLEKVSKVLSTSLRIKVWLAKGQHRTRLIIRDEHLTPMEEIKGGIRRRVGMKALIGFTQTDLNIGNPDKFQASAIQVEYKDMIKMALDTFELFKEEGGDAGIIITDKFIEEYVNV
jgi:hypothetical protein